MTKREKVLSMFYSTIHFMPPAQTEKSMHLNHRTGLCHRVVNGPLSREAVKPSANHLPNDPIVPVMDEIVLGEEMMGGVEEAVAVAMIVYAHLSRVCQVVSTVPVALETMGGVEEEVLIVYARPSQA
jgi:hypothetical protein